MGPHGEGFGGYLIHPPISMATLAQAMVSHEASWIVSILILSGLHSTKHALSILGQVRTSSIEGGGGGQRPKPPATKTGRGRATKDQPPAPRAGGLGPGLGLWPAPGVALAPVAPTSTYSCKIRVPGGAPISSGST